MEKKEVTKSPKKSTKKSTKKSAKSIQQPHTPQEDFMDVVSRTMDEMRVYDWEYVDGVVNVNCDVRIFGKFKEFPEWLQWGTIKGNFSVVDCGLKSLRGAPKKVKYIFDCSMNELESLAGCEEMECDAFCCDRNQLKDLEGAPYSIPQWFSCCHNPIKSFKGIPRFIGWTFEARKTKKHMNDDDILGICNIKQKNLIY